MSVFVVPGGPRAAGLVRREVNGEVPPAARAQVMLLLSELVNNAVIHGGVGPSGRVRVEIVRSRDSVRVEVRDNGPAFVWRAEPRPDEDEPGGFGLLLVEQFAARWGVQRDEEGTVVWFEYAL